MNKLELTLGASNKRAKTFTEKQSPNRESVAFFFEPMLLQNQDRANRPSRELAAARFLLSTRDCQNLGRLSFAAFSASSLREALKRPGKTSNRNALLVSLSTQPLSSPP